MTTDLEKKFFKVFDIKPKYQDTCTVEEKYWANEELANEYGAFDRYMDIKCGNQENCTTECSCAYQKEIYPQITDRHYLELYCTLCDAFNLLNINRTPAFAFKVKYFKECVLKDLIGIKEFYKNKHIKHQVQMIFEVEE